MKEIIGYGLVFLFIYLSYLFFVILRKKKLNKFRNNTYVKYLENVYHLDFKNVSIKRLACIIAFANAGIITVTLYVINIANHFLIKMVMAFITLIPFQLIVYHIIGKCYQIHQKKGE